MRQLKKENSLIESHYTLLLSLFAEGSFVSNMLQLHQIFNNTSIAEFLFKIFLLDSYNNKK